MVPSKSKHLLSMRDHATSVLSFLTSPCTAPGQQPSKSSKCQTNGTQMDFHRYSPPSQAPCVSECNKPTNISCCCQQGQLVQASFHVTASAKHTGRSDKFKAQHIASRAHEPMRARIVRNRILYIKFGWLVPPAIHVLYNGAVLKCGALNPYPSMIQGKDVTRNYVLPCVMSHEVLNGTVKGRAPLCSVTRRPGSRRESRKLKQGCCRNICSAAPPEESSLYCLAPPDSIPQPEVRRAVRKVWVKQGLPETRHGFVCHVECPDLLWWRLSAVFQSIPVGVPRHALKRQLFYCGLALHAVHLGLETASAATSCGYQSRDVTRECGSHARGLGQVLLNLKA